MTDGSSWGITKWSYRQTLGTMKYANGLGHVHACHETEQYAEATARIGLRIRGRHTFSVNFELRDPSWE